jgi:nitrogen-specific signal transduction histidine kinase
MSDEEKPDEGHVLRHDIRNQLSNIILAAEQLRFEVPDPTDDCKFYLDAISKSCKNINAILDATKP